MRLYPTSLTSTFFCYRDRREEKDTVANHRNSRVSMFQGCAVRHGLLDSYRSLTHLTLVSHDVMRELVFNFLSLSNIQLRCSSAFSRPHLTNADLTVRQNALGLIVGLIENVNRVTLSEQEISSLCDFLCSRLLDNQQLLSQTLHGLILLVVLSPFSCPSNAFVATYCLNIYR